MTGKRRTATMKRALKKTMMLLLAFTFVLSTLAIAAPGAALASNDSFGLYIVREHNNNLADARHVNGTTQSTVFGRVGPGAGSFRVGYQVGNNDNQVNPITIRVVNRSATTTVRGIEISMEGISSTGVTAAVARDSFRLSRTTIDSIGPGGSATFTVQPAPSLTLPTGAGATASQDRQVRINVGVPGHLDLQTARFDVRFTLLQSLTISQATDARVTLPFGQPVGTATTPPASLSLAGGGQLPSGTWRWVDMPAAGLSLGHHTRQIEFTPAENTRDFISDFPVRANVRINVVRNSVNDLRRPTMRNLDLGQTLGQARPTAGSNHTLGGTWVWVDSNGNDFSNHRPLSAGNFEFRMEFRPNVTANFDGFPTTASGRRAHPVTQLVPITVAAPTLEFRANDIEVVVGATMPTLTYRINGLISGDQPASRPTLRLESGVNTSTVGVFRDAIIIEGGSLPSGSAGDNYAGVRHVHGTVRVVAAGGGGGAGGGGAAGGGGQQVGNWRQEGGVWYLRNAAGQNLTGWQQEGGLWYFLHTADTRGTAPLASMATGWLRCPDDGEYYYLRSGGDMSTGWVQTGGNWFFMSGSGAMRTNEWVQSGGLWYFMGSDGRMVSGDWVQSGGQWYYMRTDGAMVTGNQTIGGVRHRFASDGRWLGQG